MHGPSPEPIRLRARLLLPLLVVACGLESAGTLQEDAASDPSPDGGPSCACFAALEPGWTYVAYDADANGPCSGDWAALTPRATTEVVAPPATCTCTCGIGTLPTCTLVSASVSAFANANCSGGADKTFAVTGACFDVNPDYNPNGTVSAKGTAVATALGGTCAAPTVTKDVPAPVVHEGRACPLVGPLGTGCAATDACVPRAPEGSRVCISSEAADATCPARWPTKHRVGATFTDGRDCSACTCAGAPGCTVEGQFFNDNGTCAGNKKEGQPFVLDGVCRVATNTGVSGHSLGVTTSGVQKCTPQGFGPVGGISYGAEATICCP
jgi:hypothetical protein